MPLFDGNTFERSIALAIAAVIVVTAFIASLENDATNNSDIFERQAQQIAIETMGLRARSEIEVSYDLGDAVRRWDTLDAAGIAAENRDEVEMAEAFYSARDEVVKLSRVLQDYENPDGGFLEDIYYADTYLFDITLGSERFTNTANIADQWGQKAQNYVAQLTIFAVTLFLLGLSTTIQGASRWIFVVIGAGLFFVTLGWTVQTFQSSVTGLSEEAIIAYAQAETRYAAADDTDLTIALYTRAIEIEPSYAKAYVGRGNLYRDVDELENSITDYERAIELGITDPSVLNSLGFNYFLSKNFETARQLAEQRIIAETRLALDYFDLGLIYYAGGDTAQGLQAYQEGIAYMTTQVNTVRNNGQEISSDLLFQLDVGIRDLYIFTDCVQFDYCITLTQDDLTNDPETVATALDTIVWLSESLVALEYRQPLPEFEADTSLDTVRAVDTSTDEAREVFPEYTTGYIIDYSDIDIDDGQSVIIKSFNEYDEDLTLRYVDTYEAGDDQQTLIGFGEESVFLLFTGLYRVEVYVDYQFVAQTKFSIEEGFFDDEEEATADEGDIEFIPVDVTIEGDVATYVDEAYNFQFSYPSDWFNLEQYDDGAYITEHPDDFTFIYAIVIFDEDGDDPIELASLYGDIYGVDISNIEPIDIDGQAAVEFDFVLPDTSYFVGRVAALYHDGNILLFSVETEEQDTDIDGLFTDLVNSIRLQ